MVKFFTQKEETFVVIVGAHEWALMREQRRRSLRRKVEGEFKEDTNINDLIETLLKSFLRSGSNYGLITDIETDVGHVFRIVQNLISEKNLNISALRIRDEIYLSKAVDHFDELYEVIRGRASLKAKKGLMEVWDDDESRILHFLVPSLRRHFPIEYEDDGEREEIIKSFLSSCAD